MDKIKVITGTTSVYDSHKIKEPFKQANDYPIVWEVIFRNDTEGKAFAVDLAKTFRELLKEKGFVLDTEIPTDEPVRCIECVFKDKDSFRKVLNQVFKERSFMDEPKEQIVPKIKLLDDASKLMQRYAAVAC